MSAATRRPPTAPLAPASREDLLRQPEDRTFELVGGALVEREVARLEHGRTQLKIGSGIGPFDRRSGGDGSCDHRAPRLGLRDRLAEQLGS